MTAIALPPAGGTSNGDDHPFDRQRPPPALVLPTPSAIVGASDSVSSPSGVPLPLFLPFALTRPLQCASQTSPSPPRTGPRSAYPLSSTTGAVCTLSISPTSSPYQSSDSFPSTSTRHQLAPATLQLSHTSRLFDFHFSKNTRNHDHGRWP